MDVWMIEKKMTAKDARGFLTVNNVTGSQIGLSMHMCDRQNRQASKNFGHDVKLTHGKPTQNRPNPNSKLATA